MPVNGPVRTWFLSFLSGLVVCTLGADVNGGCGESSDVVQQVVFGVMRKIVGGQDVEVGIDGDVCFGAQSVSDPADAQVEDTADTVDGSDGVVGLVDQLGVDGVHEACADLRDG